MVLSVINRSGRKEGLLKQNKNIGDVALMRHTLGFPGYLHSVVDVFRGREQSMREEVNEITIYEMLKEIIIAHGIQKRHAALIQMKVKLYADLLRFVKQPVDPNEMGVEINRTMKTSNRDLLCQ